MLTEICRVYTCVSPAEYTVEAICTKCSNKDKYNWCKYHLDSSNITHAKCGGPLSAVGFEPLGETASVVLRASDEDRDETLSALADAWVHGMLTKEEYDERVLSVAKSRFRTDLAELVKDVTVPPKKTALAVTGRRATPPTWACLVAIAVVIACFAIMFIPVLL